MRRNEFLRQFLLLSAGLSFGPSLLSSCKKEEIEVKFSGKVIIIGGGAAGMFAAYTLQHFGIEFELLEANPVLGGRVKRTNTFADFPIDIGAEWIHAGSSLFSELLKYGDQEGVIDVIPYNPETIYLGKNGKLTELDFGTNVYGENKFANTTWYDFFEDYIIPHISESVYTKAVVKSVDYSEEMVNVTTEDGTIYTGDKVIVTVPIKILQEDFIEFIPKFDQDRIDSINGMLMPDGIKVFVEFSEQFYPDILFMDSIAQNEGEKIFYNAAFKKKTTKNILGLFTVKKPSSEFTNLETDDEIINKVLTELDELYGGKATKTYMNHVIQNWSKEPFIGGSYSHSVSNLTQKQDAIRQPINQKVYFAGEALSEFNLATVHGAAESGTQVAETIIKGE